MRTDIRAGSNGRAGQTRVDGATAEGYSPIPFGERHVLDYARVLYKRRWTAIPVVVAIVGYVAYSTFSATPVYEARAQLLIEAERQNVISFQEVVEQDRATADYYQTQYRILQSRSLAKSTIDALQLWNHPELGGRQPDAPPPPPTRLQRIVRPVTQLTASLATRLTGRTLERPVVDAQSRPEETSRQARVIHAFLGRLTIEPVRNSRLVDVKFRSVDPKLAASVANALAQQFIQQNLQFKFQASKEATDWLTDQLMSQRKLVEDSEIALQRYRERSGAIAAESSENIVIQKLMELNTAVTSAKTDRIQKEALYRQLESVLDDPVALHSFPAILSNVYIQQLKADVAELERRRVQLDTELGERHPDMVNLVSALATARAKLQAEVRNVAQSIEREYRTALAHETSLISALEAQKGEALALNRKEIGYRVLEREASTNRQIFETLLQRARETGISGELKTNNIRVADLADVPSSPLWPRKVRDLAMALLVGSMLGIGLAFGREYLDNKIKSPDEIKTHLGLPCLGMVPRIPRKVMREASPLMNDGVPASFAEAFRAVRTNVLFSSAAGGRIQSVLVTSTGPGEGKTLVASNLAAGIALTGQRVVLLDADLRRPRTHDVFRMARDPGLADMLMSTAAAHQVVRKTDIRNLWVVPAGRTTLNPAELLSSPRFGALFAALKRQFDWVIVDSPPIMPVTDASIVAHTTSAVLFVVGSEVVTVPAAVRALEQLDTTDATFVGAVLNGVNLKRNAFFYSPYYRREYGQYYGGSAQS